jgi:hypothetical protein
MVDFGGAWLTKYAYPRPKLGSPAMNVMMIAPISATKHQSLK